MTPKENIIQAIRHKETEIIPYSLDFCGDAAESLGRHPSVLEAMAGFTKYIARIAAYGFPREAILPNDIHQDAFGTQWDKSRDKGVGVVVAPMFNEKTFDSYEFPNPIDIRYYTHFPKFCKKNVNVFKIAVVPMCYFERSWALYGFENILADMLENECFVCRILEEILDYDLKLIGRYIEFDVDCVHLNDDYGQQHGLIMGPQNWRKYFKPGIKTMAEMIHKAGKYVYMHSCGDISEIMPDLIEIGIDILNPLQPETMDVFSLKKEYGNSISFHGGVSEQKVLARGTQADVRTEVLEKLEKLGKRGGYICAPSQEITKDVSIENILEFIKIVKQDNNNQWRQVK